MNTSSISTYAALAALILGMTPAIAAADEASSAFNLKTMTFDAPSIMTASFNLRSGTFEPSAAGIDSSVFATQAGGVDSSATDITTATFSTKTNTFEGAPRG